MRFCAWLMLWLAPAWPAFAQTRLPSRVQGAVFDRATGAMLVRETHRLLHVAPDATISTLPAFPRHPLLLEPLLLTAHGLWVRDDVRFAFFRPSDAGWSAGSWLVSRDFPREVLDRVTIVTAGESSPVFTSGGEAVRLHASETEIEEREERGYAPPVQEAMPALRLDPATQRCVLDPWPTVGGTPRALPELPTDPTGVCALHVETHVGRLWLRSPRFLITPWGDDWFLISREYAFKPERSAPIVAKRHWLDRAAPAFAALAVGAALTAGAYATPSSRGLALGRTSTATLAAGPMAWLFANGFRHGTSGAHNFDFMLLVPAGLLLSPLPMAANLSVGAIGDDSARNRTAAGVPAWGASLGAAALVVPLTLFMESRMQPRMRVFTTLIAMSVIGLASSVTYSYTASP